MLTHVSFNKVVLWFLGLGILLILSGCKPDEQTAGQIAELQTELDAVRQRLDEASSQREALALKLQTLSETLTETQQHVQPLARLSDDTRVMDSQLDALKTYLAEVVSQRDAAMAEANETRAMLAQLHSQLQQHIETVQELGIQVADLQEALAPPVEEAPADVQESQPKSNAPVVGFPEVPGLKE